MEGQSVKGSWETVIQDLDQISECFVFKSPACEWFFYLKDNSLTSWAFSSAYWALGMFTRSGLFDIINDPLAYKAQSEVWREPSRFVWSADLSSSGDIYFILNLIPAHLSLFLPLKVKKLWTGGLVTNIPLFDFLNYELLFKTCHSLTQSLENEGWFLERISVRGFYYQLAQRFLLQFTPFELGLDLGTSLADLVSPALFLSLNLSYNTKPLSLYALLSYRSPNYIGKELLTESEILKLSLNIKWQILSWLALEIDFMRKYDDSESLDLLEGFGEWLGEIKTDLVFYNKKQRLNIELGYKYSLASHYQEEIKLSHKITLVIQYRLLKLLLLELGYNLEVLTESLLHKLKAAFELEFDCFKLTTDLCLEFVEEVYMQAKVKLVAETGPFVLWVGCELKRFQLKELGLEQELGLLDKLESHLGLSLGLRVYY